MEASGERTRELRQIDRAESRLLWAALAVLVACAAGVVAADAGASAGASHVVRNVCFVALVVGFAVDVAVRSRRLRDARRAVASAGYERRDLLRRVGELSDFVAGLRRLDEAVDGEEIARVLASEARRLTAADDAFVVARDLGGRAALAAVAGVEQAPGLETEESAAFDRWLDDDAPPLLLRDDPSIRARFAAGPLFAHAASVAGAPLLAGGRVFGGVVVVRRVAGSPGFDVGALQALGLLTDAAGRVAAARDAGRRAARQRRRLELSLQRLSRAQAELVRAEKSRAVADLVASVAHELNNPLTAVAGYAQLLARRPELAGGPGAEWAREAALEAERCGEILRRLSTFARRGAAENPARAPLATVVQDVLALKAYDLRAAGVQVETAIDEGVASAMDRSLLQHVLLNLVNNAITALRGAPRRALRIAGTDTPSGLELRVADSGPGVPSALRERIFDPFFTTRTGEDATGLGLSTCRELLGKAGGTIELERVAPGETGATFVVRLPAATGAAAIAPEPAAA